jgi:hypothetical protein
MTQTKQTPGFVSPWIVSMGSSALLRVITIFQTQAQGGHVYKVRSRAISQIAFAVFDFFFLWHGAL